MPIPREKKQCAAAAGAHLGTKSTYLLLLAMEEGSCESLIFEATPPPKGAGMSLVARALALALELAARTTRNNKTGSKKIELTINLGNFRRTGAGIKKKSALPNRS